MSVFVKDMEMPDYCANCPFFDWRYPSARPGERRLAYCRQTHENLGVYVPFEEHLLKDPEHCPLVDVPAPHGRLIDADKLEKDHAEAERGSYGGAFFVGDNRFMKRFAEAPTVIEAEGEK